VRTHSLADTSWHDTCCDLRPAHHVLDGKIWPSYAVWPLSLLKRDRFIKTRFQTRCLKAGWDEGYPLSLFQQEHAIALPCERDGWRHRCSRATGHPVERASALREGEGQPQASCKPAIVLTLAQRELTQHQGRSSPGRAELHLPGSILSSVERIGHSWSQAWRS